MNTDKPQCTEDNTDDLIMDSMLRQFVNSEVQRFRFAEQVNAAIQDSQEPEFHSVGSEEQGQDSQIGFDFSIHGRGRVFLRVSQVAAVAAAILLALWLPNRQNEPAQPVAKRIGPALESQVSGTNPDYDLSNAGTNNADSIKDDANRSSVSNDRAFYLNGGSQSIKDADAQTIEDSIAGADNVVQPIRIPLDRLPFDRLPIRSELVMADEEAASGSLKIVRAENEGGQAPSAPESLVTAQANDDDAESVQQIPLAHQKVEKVDASLFPDRKLEFEIKVSSSAKSAYVAINDERISKKIRCDNLARGLKLLEPGISRRLRFIGPRVGCVVGTVRYESDEVRFGLDFENERQLRSVLTRICDRLQKFGPSSKRSQRNTTSADEFLSVALKKTNEVLRKWAKDSLEMGNVSLEPEFESESRFQRVISKASLERFAKTGFFQIPEPEEIYLPSTQLQFLQPENLRKDLLTSTRQLDLFESKTDMEEFAKKYTLKGKRTGMSRKSSEEPLKEILKQREDLQGLPLVMDDDCHLGKQRAQKMNEVSKTVGPILNRFDRFASRNVDLHPTARRQMLNSQIQNVKSYFSRTSDSPQALLTIDQMLQIEDTDMRIELVKLLEESRSPMSASLLACYAKFDLSPRVRVLATSALSGFPRSFYQKKLIEGMRYPWPEAAKHSAEALVRLNDVDSIPSLVEMLKNPDPRVPVHVGGEYVKKELVAINHLKNCMLCHADSQSVADRGQAPVPVWGQELPRTYYNFRSPGLLMARADITYMRQDFSVVQEVEGAKPWPTHQRFDYVVQDRKLTREQYDQLMLEKTMDSNTYEQAIVFALQMLTGESPSDNSYESWSAIAERIRVLP